MTNSEQYAPSLILSALAFAASICGIVWYTVSRSRKAPEDPGSALHGSIKGKKDLSYYYAHAPRDTKEAPAAMPVHTPIAKETYTPGERITPIKTFQFLDDTEFVKVYLPLEELDKITMENVTASFEPTSFSVTVRGLKSTPLQFSVSKLHKDINPEGSTIKIMKTKILVKLKKVLDGGEEEEDDTMDAEAPGEEEIIDAGTDEPVVEGETPEGLEAEPARALTEDMGVAGEAEHVPDLDGLAIEGKAVADPNESLEKESKPKKKPHFPRWYSLRG